MTRKQKEKKKVFLKCVPKSNVIENIFWVLVFSIPIWYLAYPTDRSIVENMFLIFLQEGRWLFLLLNL